MFNLTQFVLRFLISFLLVFFFACFYCPFTPAKMFFILLMCIYIFSFFYFIIHLIMTEARSKRRVLPLVCIFNYTSQLSCIKRVLLRKKALNCHWPDFVVM